MRKYFILLLLTFFSINSFSETNDTKVYDWDKVINALIEVESKGDEKAVSKNKKFVGILQISTILVDDCNRIIGEKKYTYNCRYDKTKSIEMFKIIQNYYNPKKDLTFAIRMWKGGPTWKTNSIDTKEYYNKVMKEYNKKGNY